MKILIIGHGFIAKSIIARLVNEGHEVTVFSRNLVENSQARQELGDIFDFSRFSKVLARKFEIVIHTAWITTYDIYRNDVSNLKYAEFTKNLAQYLIHSDINHLVVLGSCAEYGIQYAPSTAGLTRTNPQSIYAEQKVEAFNATKEILEGSSVRFTWARIFYPYGPNQDQSRLIPYLINELEAGKTPLLMDLTSVYDWITTRDIASAISWVIQQDLPTEIDIGTSVGFTNLELLEALGDLLQISSQINYSEIQKAEATQMFVVGKNSPLFGSGWLPDDSLRAGLDWILQK